MENFVFSLPTNVHFGKGQIQALGTAIKPFGASVLIVYGKGSVKKNGVLKAVTDQLDKHSITWNELGDVDPNPRIDSVREGARLCREHKVDLVLAVGGGSVIDCSKGIAMAALAPEVEPWDIWAGKVNPVTALPVGAVLTLAATASEMNRNSVISNPATREKKGHGHECLIPRFAIMDPAYTFTVPPRHTAAGIADTMAHIFEYYFSDVPGAYLQNQFCDAVLRTVVEYGPTAMSKPDDYEARANLMWASSMALNGVTSRGKLFDGALHGIEHAFSALYDISHGEGLAILIPHWMESVIDARTQGNFARYARNVWGVTEPDDARAAKAAVEKTRSFFVQLNLPARLRDVGVADDTFDEMAQKSLRGQSVGNVRKFSKDDVVELIRKAW